MREGKRERERVEAGLDFAHSLLRQKEGMERKGSLLLLLLASLEFAITCEVHTREIPATDWALQAREREARLPAQGTRVKVLSDWVSLADPLFA